MHFSYLIMHYDAYKYRMTCPAHDCIWAKAESERSDEMEEDEEEEEEVQFGSLNTTVGILR